MTEPATAPIDAIGVVMPARDEQDLIGTALDHLRTALRQPTGPTIRLCVVLDRCTDHTPDIVHAALRDWPGATALTITAAPPGTGVGRARHRGLTHLLSELPTPTERTWLLSVDADTTVPPHWATSHLHHATTGAHAVAAPVELDATPGLSAQARAHHGRLAAPHHGGIYAANLGVRADAYQAAGGFPPDGPGEDHRLWRALTATGAALVRPRDPTVRTSARLDGRAAGGLADLLTGLNGAPPTTRRP